MPRHLIGVDIGGTSVRVAIAPVDDLKAFTKLKQDTAKTDANALGRQVIAMIEELLKKQGIETMDVSAISIATAGPIDAAKGEVFNNANLGFKVIPLKAPIASRFPAIPINIINDCRSAILGVHCFEAKDDEKDNVGYITISTGIGGGFVVNGHLVLGKEGNASEIGHGTIAPRSGVRCNCGAEGCWEAFCSGWAIAKHARDALEAKPGDGTILLDLVRGDRGKITARDVYEAARKGDTLAKGVVDQATYYNAIGLGLVNNFYDPRVIYIGGSMLKDEQQILPPVQDLLANRTIEFTINHPPRLAKTTLGDDVGLLGALALGKYKIEKHPVVSTFK
ncbi:MAG: ROK family protein [Candidatus Lokiarchaeota archaeon]|nr:ROK family protein [Candidatus Lokiarchaeota archaeon]